MDALASQVALSRGRQLFRMIKPGLGPVIVLAVALAAASGLWLNYQANWRHLWTDVVHDRNAHLEAGIAFASDLLNARIGELARDIDRARTWPPLHDIFLVGAAIMPVGLDPRLAVLPGLACYIGTAFFAFLLARRLAGTTAGAVAATLLLVSPAQRAFATDVMLEGPGACATLAALYAAVRARQENTRSAWTGLAIALSVLFFVKYNYWLLVALAISPLLRFALVSRPVLISLVKHPLSIIAILFVCLAFALKYTHQSPQFAVTAAWWCAIARSALWLRSVDGRPLHADQRWGPLIRWHAFPTALWLAWPGKLSSFLWVLWPGTNVGEFPTSDRLAGITFYITAITTDYHIAMWSAAIVLLAMSAAIVAYRQFTPGWGIVLAFLLLSAVLTMPHPNRKSRFVHSWLPAAWVLAGCGVGALTRSRLYLAKPVGISIATLLVAAHLPALAEAAHAPEGGPRPDQPSALELTEAYLPQLAHTPQAGRVE